MPVHKSIGRQIESGFDRLFPKAPSAEELTPDLDFLRSILAQFQSPDYIRNQVAEIMGRIPDTSVDFEQRVTATGGSVAQANEQAEAFRRERSQTGIDLSNKLIAGGQQQSLGGLLALLGIEQEGLFGAAGASQDRTAAIQSFINQLLGAAGGAAGAAAGGGGISGRVVTPNERLGGIQGGTQGLGPINTFAG